MPTSPPSNFVMGRWPTMSRCVVRVLPPSPWAAADCGSSGGAIEPTAGGAIVVAWLASSASPIGGDERAGDALRLSLCCELVRGETRPF